MQELGVGIFVAAVLILVGFASWMKFRGEMFRRQMVFDAQRQILDKLGSASEVTQFLASPEGREFLDRLNPPPPPPPRKPGQAEVVWQGFIMTWAAVVLTFAGIGFLVLAATIHPNFMVVGTLCTTIGVGLLVGLVITHHLARRWGFFKPPTSETETRGLSNRTSG